ncbi:Uncharacterised protein [Vibrio cholerae]|nr:Uncharacterised protein [Vibrio cholerae]CSB63346.1 Uncharacterised protein [Vibrio cholerae]
MGWVHSSIKIGIKIISFATSSRRSTQSRFALIDVTLHRLIPRVSVLIVALNELATRSTARRTLSSAG